MNGYVDDIFQGLGVEIALKNSEDFLKVKETLTRVGVDLDILYRNELSNVENKSVPGKTKTLYQSCHILHKRGRYAILHFKELFALDGKHSDITDIDIARRNTIVKLLNEWNMIEILNKEQFFMIHDFAEMNQLKIIPHKNKNDWNLVAKYNIGSHIEH